MNSELMFFVQGMSITLVISPSTFPEIVIRTAEYLLETKSSLHLSKYIEKVYDIVSVIGRVQGPVTWVDVVRCKMTIYHEVLVPSPAIRTFQERVQFLKEYCGICKYVHYIQAFSYSLQSPHSESSVFRLSSLRVQPWDSNC